MKSLAVIVWCGGEESRRESQLSHRQLQISNRGDRGCSKFQFCP